MLYVNLMVTNTLSKSDQLDEALIVKNETNTNKTNTMPDLQ